MTDVDDDVRQLYSAFQQAQTENPNLVPYIGPEGTLQRFLAGAVVTRQEFVCDQSPFTMKAVLPVQLKRLRWMLDHSKPVLGVRTDQQEKPR